MKVNEKKTHQKRVSKSVEAVFKKFMSENVSKDPEYPVKAVT